MSAPHETFAPGVHLALACAEEEAVRTALYVAISRWRRQTKSNYTELGRVLGVSRATIQNWLTPHESRLTIVNVVRLCSATGVDYRHLLHHAIGQSVQPPEEDS